MMKIQFSNKNMTVPDRVYSHAEQRINELDHLFRGEPEAVVVFSAEDGKHVIERSEERRVGKECRCRWARAR